MATGQSVNTPPDARAGRASPLQRGRRRLAIRWIAHGVLFVALAAGIFGLLPRLGGLTRDAAGLRHARPAFPVAAIERGAAHPAGHRSGEDRRDQSLDTAVQLIVAPRIPRIHFLPKRAVFPSRRNMSSTAARWPIATLKPMAR